MRTIALLGAAAAALAAGAGAAVTSASGGSTAETIRLFEHDRSQANIDLGRRGDSAGDLFVVSGDLFDHKGGTRRGSLAAVFTTVSAGAHGEALAAATFTLPGGEISTEGVFVTARLFGGRRLSFPISGGTGRYRDARGEGTIQAPNETDATFVLRLR